MVPPLTPLNAATEVTGGVTPDMPAAGAPFFGQFCSTRGLAVFVGLFAGHRPVGLATTRDQHRSHDRVKPSVEAEFQSAPRVRGESRSS